MSHRKHTCQVKGCVHKSITYKRIPVHTYEFDAYDRVMTRTKIVNLYLCRRCYEKLAAFKREAERDHE